MNKIITLVVLLSFGGWCVRAQTLDLFLYSAKNTSNQKIIDSVGLYIDTESDIALHQILDSTFDRVIHPLPRAKSKIAYWQRFSIINQESTKLEFEICSHRQDLHTIYILREKNIDTIELGIHTFLRDPYRHYCAPIRINKNESIDVYSRQWRQIHASRAIYPLEIYTPDGAKKYYESIIDKDSPGHISGLVTVMIILFLFLFWILHYIINPSNYLKFYCLYIFFLLLFYLRNVEIHRSINILFSYFPQYTNYLEIDLSYCVYLTYMMFLMHLFNLTSKEYYLTKLVKFIALCCLALLVGSIVFQLFGQFELTYEIFRVFRISMIFAIPSIMILLGYYVRNVVCVFILLGALLFFIPSFVSILMLSFDWTHLGHSTWLYRNIGIGGKFSFYMYHTKIGLLMELLCFSASTAHKTYRLKNELLDLKKQINWLRGYRESIAKNIENVDSNLNSPFLERLKSHILKNLSNNLTIAQLCRDMAVSRTKLHNDLRKHTGLSTSHFINVIRIEEAEYLLRSTDLNISEVAYKVGFNDSSYFTQVFKKINGQLPSEWKKG